MFQGGEFSFDTPIYTSQYLGKKSAINHERERCAVAVSVDRRPLANNNRSTAVKHA
jgi:hypothetical protein